MSDDIKPAEKAAETPLYDADVLVGAEEIAKFVFGDVRKRRRVYAMVEAERLPTFRVGPHIHSRKSWLRRWFKDQENAALKTEAAA